MKYQITTTYECEETTCGELARQVNSMSMQSMYEFIDPINPTEILSVHNNCDWLHTRSPMKKLLLVRELESKGGKIWEI